MSLVFVALTPSQLRDYLSADAIRAYGPKAFEGGANIRLPLSQGTQFKDDPEGGNWTDLAFSDDPVKRQYYDLRMAKSVAYQVRSNALRNDNIYKALTNDIPFPTNLKLRTGRNSSLEIHRNVFTIPQTSTLKIKQETVRASDGQEEEMLRESVAERSSVLVAALPQYHRIRHKRTNHLVAKHSRCC